MTKLSGFITRSWQTKDGKRHICYYYRSSRASGRKLTTLGTDYTEALRNYADIIGTQLIVSLNGSVASVYSEYLPWAVKRATANLLSERRIRDIKSYWRHLEPVFGECDAGALEQAWMYQYFEERSSQVSAKKELKFLCAMLNWGLARGKIRGINPMMGGFMKQLEVHETREIYVTDEWYDLVHKHGNQLVKDALDACLLFTFRPAECQRSKLADIEGDELCVALEKTKRSGIKEKRIPLDKKHLAFIKIQRNKTPRSFFLVSDESGQPLRINNTKFKNAFKKARDDAQAEADKLGIHFERFQLRDIRAKSATEIARDYGIEAARLMCGHTTQKQTSDYIRSIKGAAKIAFMRASGESDS